MELNREQIVKALECCTNNHAEADCLHCPYEMASANCMVALMKDTLALINSQEQRIEDLEATLKVKNEHLANLQELCTKIEYDAEKLTKERDTFRECAYNLQELVRNIGNKQSEGYEPSAAKASAEMEMWRVIALQKKELTEQNERLHATCTELTQKLHDVQKCGAITLTVNLDEEQVKKIKSECLACIDLDINEIKADTVRKMQERLRFEIINKPSEFRADQCSVDFLNGLAHRQNEILNILDQIAKELTDEKIQ